MDEMDASLPVASFLSLTLLEGGRPRRSLFFFGRNPLPLGRIVLSRYKTLLCSRRSLFFLLVRLLALCSFGIRYSHPLKTSFSFSSSRTQSFFFSILGAPLPLPGIRSAFLLPGASFFLCPRSAFFSFFPVADILFLGLQASVRQSRSQRRRACAPLRDLPPSREYWRHYALTRRRFLSFFSARPFCFCSRRTPFSWPGLVHPISCMMRSAPPARENFLPAIIASLVCRNPVSLFSAPHPV